MSRSPSPPTTVSRRRRKRALRSPNKATIEVITISDDEKTPSPKRKNYKSPHNEIVLITTPSPPKSPYRPRQYPDWVYRKSSSKSKSKSKSSSGSSSSKSPSPRRRRPTPPSPIPRFLGLHHRVNAVMWSRHHLGEICQSLAQANTVTTINNTWTWKASGLTPTQCCLNMMIMSIPRAI